MSNPIDWMRDNAPHAYALWQAKNAPDPLLLRAREYVAKLYDDRGKIWDAYVTRKGDWDGSVSVQAVHAALRDAQK